MLIVTSNNHLDALVTIDGEIHSSVGSAVKAIRAAYQEMRLDNNLCDLDITFGRRADKTDRTSILHQANRYMSMAFCDAKTASIVQQAAYLCATA